MHSKAKVHRLFPNVTQRDIQGSFKSKLLLIPSLQNLFNNSRINKL